MTAPAEKPRAGEKSPGGLAQLVRWLNEERPMTTADDGGFVAGAPHRAARWRYGEPLAPPPQPEVERDVLGEVRIGPAPRCAVAGETIALSVSLISARGDMYLGWPIKLEWTSSDPSIATVSDGGIVEVRAKGRVELTCTCEGKSGSVLLTVVEPAVAAAVGLPVPARLLPVPPPRPAVDARTSAERTTAEVMTPMELPSPHRRSVERGSVKHRILASRGTRRFLVRLAAGAVAGTFVVIALTQSPEEYFIVGAEPPPGIGARPPARTTTAPRRQSAARPSRRPAVGAPVSPATRDASAPLPNTPTSTALNTGNGRAVAEAAGSTTVTSAAPVAPETSPRAQPSVVAAPAPTVSRVVVTSSPSQLTEGESVRLSAAGVDDRGDPVASRAVTWTSENGDVAVVDENGVVTARRPGTVTIVATSEGRAGRVTLTVGARRAAPPAAPAAAPPAAESTPLAAAPPRETGAAAVARTLRARADEFVQALRERNGERVAALYRAESPQDRKNLQVLLERLRRPEARFKAADAQLGATLIGEMEATADVQVPMSWTTPFGRVRNQTATFRAVLEPGDGGWRLVSIRAVGKID